VKNILIGMIVLNSLGTLMAYEATGDTVKLNVATQTFQCNITNQSLNCSPINQVSQKTIDVPKNAGKFQVQDSPKGLSMDVSTAFADSEVSYHMTLCSNTTCTINDSYGGAEGRIDQVMYGQYNLTEKSFSVLAVAISSTASNVNLLNRIQNAKF